MIRLPARFKAPTDPWTSLLADKQFWADFRADLARELHPLFLGIFAAGAIAASTIKPRPAPETREKALPSPELDAFLDIDALVTLGERTIGDYVNTFSKSIADDTYDQVRSAVLTSRRTGTGVEGVLKDITPLFSPRRAEVIAVTETTRLFAQGAQAVYRAQGFDGWEWMTVNDPRVDPACASMTGVTYPMDQEFVPKHPSCLLPKTPVWGARARFATKRVYEGEVIALSTASGDNLAVTPNHPILTIDGWRAAGSLQIGDQVVCDRAEVHAPLLDPYDVEMPPLIKDVWEALSVHRAMMRVAVPTTTEDFHGDGLDGEVDIVGADGELLRYREATIAQQTEHLALVIADVTQRQLVSSSSSGLLVKIGNAPAHRTMGRFNLLHSALGRPRRTFHNFRLRTAANTNVGIKQSPPNSEAPYVERSRKSVFALAGKVAGDDLLVGQLLATGETALASLTVVRRFPYRGHVYNLQTATGWYVAGGMVTHNCRCFPSPVVTGKVKPIVFSQETQDLIDARSAIRKWKPTEWEKAKPWTKSKDDFAAGKVPGILYTPGTTGSTETALAHNAGPVIRVHDRFFTEDLEGRRFILYHEAGHDVDFVMARDGTAESLFAPFKIEGDRYSVGWSGSTNLHEIIPNTYAAAITEGAPYGEVQPLFDYVLAVAKALGLPTPSG